MATVGVPRETAPGERRVALTPAVIPSLVKADMRVVIEAGAGEAAGYPDKAYQDKGAEIVPTRAEAFQADFVLQVRTAAAAGPEAREDVALLTAKQTVIGFANSLAGPDVLTALAAGGSSVFGMELMPRITRAQSMDALSSQASIAGYKGVLLLADTLPKLFPMMTTAAGTIAPAHVLVLGVGVAGLQAIATAKRLGAVVEAYDVRAAVAEQVESLGARFVDLELDSSEAEGEGGYAKEQSEDFLRRQQEALGRVVATQDCVITTALVPGKQAPILLTADMVRGMAPGSVVVDLAAEQGGNCELTQPGEVIEAHGVTIVGTTNLPTLVPKDASQMYAKNIATFLLHLAKEEPVIDLEDEITRETLIIREGAIVHPRVRAACGLPELAIPEAEPGPEPEPETAPEAEEES